MNDNAEHDPRLYAIPDLHGHAKGEHKAFIDERPIPLSARMLFLWFYHACRRGWPRFLMVSDHMNYLTFEDPAAINLVRRALKLAQAGDLYGAAETASVEVGHAAVVSDGLRRGMRYSIGAEVDNDPRSRPDAQNIVDAMKPDGMIRSVHFLTIDHPAHGPNWSWPFDNPEFADVYETVGTAKTWEMYMATLLDAVERLPGNIVGHFYVPALFGHWPDDATLETYEDQIVEACKARGMAIELNTRFLYRQNSEQERAKYLHVHRRLLAKCKANNVGIAVGSDAHSPKDQGHAFGQVLALLDECAINELVFPIAGRLARVALRVERKAEAVAVVDPVAVLPDDRKAPRKLRTSEVPARSKETSFQRDADADADDPVSADAAGPPPKPRPKRSKIKAAARSTDQREADDTTVLETAASVPADVEPPADGEPPAAVEDSLVEPVSDELPDEVEPPAGHDLLPIAGEPPASAERPLAAAASSRAEPAPNAPADSAKLPAGSEQPSPGALSADEPVVAEATVGDTVSGSEAEARPAEPKTVLEAEHAGGTPLLSGLPAEAAVRKARPNAGAVKSRPAAAGGKPKPSAGKAKSAAARKATKSTAKSAGNKTVAAAKKAAGKKPIAAKKSSAKKAPDAKITIPRKAAVRGTPAKKSGAKKAPTKKPASKKSAQKRR